MLFVSYNVSGRGSWGAATDAGIVDLGMRFPEYPSLRTALETYQVTDIAEIALRERSADYQMSEVILDPVIPDPGQILCVGLNYDEHRAECRREATARPTIFARYGRSQIGHNGTILLPPESETLDYEGELALVIGKKGRRISEQDALSHVAGYACYNDASVREFQRHSTQFHPGKNFPATGAFGPYMVTADEIPDPSLLSIETHLNGQVVQAAGLDQLIFTVPELIAYCSTFTELHPGDVIVTGTPGGVGMARKPPLWMRDGDVVEVIIPRVGHLINTVAQEYVAGSDSPVAVQLTS